MKPLKHSQVTAVLNLSFIVLALKGTEGQGQGHGGVNGQNPPNYNNPDQVNDYNYQQNYGNYEADYNSVPEPKTVDCYSCTFHVRMGTMAGHDNCRDPFIKDKINTVPCKEQCAKIFHKTSDTEYTVTRTCLPKCRSIMDEKGYTQCCFGHLCNGSSRRLTVSLCGVVLAAIFAIVAFTPASGLLQL